MYLEFSSVCQLVFVIELLDDKAMHERVCVCVCVCVLSLIHI